MFGMNTSAGEGSLANKLNTLKANLKDKSIHPDEAVGRFLSAYRRLFDTKSFKEAATKAVRDKVFTMLQKMVNDKVNLRSLWEKYIG